MLPDIFRLSLMAVLGAVLPASTVLAQTQQDVEPTVKSGTLIEIEEKGRSHSLKYTDDAGEQQELILTPRMQSHVEAEGDAGFLRPGQFIATIATESNNQLFATSVSVFVFGKGRIPGGKIVKAPPKSGQSQNAYQVSGPIVSIGPDEEFPQYQRVTLKASGPRAPLMLEEGFQVTVKSQDFSLAPAGTPIELEGTELRNGRFNVTKVTAKLKEPLKSDDVLGSPEEEKETKGAQTKQSKAAPAKEAE